jgi:hypothetical protein
MLRLHARSQCSVVFAIVSTCGAEGIINKSATSRDLAGTGLASIRRFELFFLTHLVEVVGGDARQEVALVLLSV